MRHNRVYTGYTYEYLEKIAQFTGVRYEYVTFADMDVDEALMKSMEMVQNGELDLIGGMLKNDALEETFEYTENNYGVVNTSLAVLENSSIIDESNLMSRKNVLRVAVIEDAEKRNEEVIHYLQELGVPYRLVACEDEEDQYQSMRDGRTDIMSTVSLSYHVGTRQIASFSPRPFFFASYKGNRELMQQMDEAITAINKTVSYFQKELYQKYFENNSLDFYITEEEKTYLRDKKSIKALCIPNCAPFVFEDKKGMPAGISVSIMEDFAENTGLSIRYDFYDEKEPFYQTFKDGNYDCVLGIPTNAQYNSACGIVTSEPYLTVDVVSFTKQRNIGKLTKDSTVALINGSDLADHIKYKDIQYYSNTLECIQAVNSGAADIGYGNSRCVEYYMYDIYANLTSIPLLSETQNMEISISKDTGDTFITLINKYIQDIEENQIYSYYAKVNATDPKNGMEQFARNYPVLSIAISAFLVFAVFACLVMLIVMRSGRKKNRELQKAYAAKTSFLSRMSHDMRTPMNAVIGMSILGLEESEDLRVKNYFEKIKQSGDYLLGLINDTLDMSKIDSDKMVLNPEPYEERAFIKTITNLLLPKASEKGVDFKVNVIGDSNCVAMVDKLHIQQIFVNLINNAIKFTPKGGEVTLVIENPQISVGTAPVRFLVKDNGIGMTEDFQKRMYDPFEQENTKYENKEMGTGLGLAIVKSLVELMGGSITCSSEPNKGTEFCVTIPLQMTSVKSAKQEADITELVQPCSLQGKHILLCEDHPVNAEIAGRLLEKKGLLVDLATDGAKGLGMFQDSEVGYYSAILMDIRMPNMDGLEATEAIRKLERTDAKTIPIIAMTANAFSEDVEHSKKAGMNVHLAKPIEPKVLYQTLEQLIK